MRFCEENDNRPVFGTDRKTGKGYCKFHQHLRTDIDKDGIVARAIKKQRQNASIKAGRQLRRLAVEDIDVKPKKDYAELERWFKDRQKEMTGKCSNCQGKTERDSRHYKCSIGHILPKAYFPSIATHPLNWLELCFYGKSCHTNMDNKMLDLTEMACWDEIVTKFCAMYPSIDKKERRRIPEVLLQYIEVEK